MTMPIELTFLGGFLAGLASSLHCAGMCAGIASSLMFTLSPAGNAKSRARVLMVAQTGRILSYVLTGAVLGVAGTALYTVFDFSAAHLVFRWIAGVILIWIGLSLTGLVPHVAVFDRILGFATRRVMQPVTRWGAASPFLGGLIWGLLPCAMVYAVLLYAMLTGSAAGGGLLMLGFGLGTLPAVTGAAFGIGVLARFGRGDRWRYAIGLVNVAIGFVGLIFTPEQIAAFCGL